jgi:hypothetical protein
MGCIGSIICLSSVYFNPVRWIKQGKYGKIFLVLRNFYYRIPSKSRLLWIILSVLMLSLIIYKYDYNRIRLTWNDYIKSSLQNKDYTAASKLSVYALEHTNKVFAPLLYSEFQKLFCEAISTNDSIRSVRRIPKIYEYRNFIDKVYDECALLTWERIYVVLQDSIIKGIDIAPGGFFINKEYVKVKDSKYKENLIVKKINGDSITRIASLTLNNSKSTYLIRPNSTQILINNPDSLSLWNWESQGIESIYRSKSKFNHVKFNREGDVLLCQSADSIHFYKFAKNRIHYHSYPIPNAYIDADNYYKDDLFLIDSQYEVQLYSLSKQSIVSKSSVQGDIAYLNRKENTVYVTSGGISVYDKTTILRKWKVSKGTWSIQEEQELPCKEYEVDLSKNYIYLCKDKDLCVFDLHPDFKELFKKAKLYYKDIKFTKEERILLGLDKP